MSISGTLESKLTHHLKLTMILCSFGGLKVEPKELAELWCIWQDSRVIDNNHIARLYTRLAHYCLQGEGKRLQG